MPSDCYHHTKSIVRSTKAKSISGSLERQMLIISKFQKSLALLPQPGVLCLITHVLCLRLILGIILNLLISPVNIFLAQETFESFHSATLKLPKAFHLKLYYGFMVLVADSVLSAFQFVQKGSIVAIHLNNKADLNSMNHSL